MDVVATFTITLRTTIRSQILGNHIPEVLVMSRSAHRSCRTVNSSATIWNEVHCFSMIMKAFFCFHDIDYDTVNRIADLSVD